jgi:hypothetical protein
MYRERSKVSYYEGNKYREKKTKKIGEKKYMIKKVNNKGGRY